MLQVIAGDCLLEYVFLQITTVLMLRRNFSVASRVGRILLDEEFRKIAGLHVNPTAEPSELLCQGFFSKSLLKPAAFLHSMLVTGVRPGPRSALRRRSDVT